MNNEAYKALADVLS